MLDFLAARNRLLIVRRQTQPDGGKTRFVHEDVSFVFSVLYRPIGFLRCSKNAEKEPSCLSLSVFDLSSAKYYVGLLI